MFHYNQQNKDQDHPSRESSRCKLEINGTIIKQLMSFRKQGTQITSNHNLKHKMATYRI